MLLRPMRVIDPRSARRVRALVALTLAAALLVPTAAPAIAWNNGPNDGNGYGTHDWLIDEALDVLNGRADDWFDRDAALLVSDDPDTIERAADPDSKMDHVYRTKGRRGGAIDRITEHFAAAMALYQQGVAARDGGDGATAQARFTAASRQIGLLAHFYGDILQPYHTANRATDYDAEHHRYEDLVGERTNSRNESPGWSSSRRTVIALSNVRKTAIAAAAYSRSKYSTLHSSFHPKQSVLNGTVSGITRDVLVRAQNDLADVIWSVSQGTGNPPAVRSLSLHISWQGTRKGATQLIRATARDVNGNPIEGLRIGVRWPLPGGGTTTLEFWTDGSGVGVYSGSVGRSPLMLRRSVVASATTNGTTVSASTWYYTTRKLKAGLAGFKTKVTDTTVVPGQVVTVRSYAKDAFGRPIAGLKVTWTWNFGGVISKTTADTDANGRATSSVTITTATTMKTVTVTARTQAHNVSRSSSTSFRRVP